MLAKAAVELDSVTKYFDGVPAVENVSLSIAEGDIICLVGESGCGKSTLLRLIAGVDHPDAGRISMKGREVSGPCAFVEPEARNIGFVFQDYALFPHLTVMQNVLFGLRRRKKAEAAHRASEILEQVGITHLKERFPHMLSGGEQQRVALARALAPRPELLLMDEPFSNLDQGLRHRIRDNTLSLLKQLGSTVVMVTHDPGEALSAGDKVVLMRNGVIVQAGSNYDLHDNPASPYAAEFFSEFNKIPGRRRGNRIDTALGVFPLQDHQMMAQEQVVFYVRPHAIGISLQEGDLDGWVEKRSFHGDFEQFHIRVDRLEEPLLVRTAKRLPLDLHHVRLSVDRSQALPFPATEKPETL